MRRIFLLLALAGCDDGSGGGGGLPHETCEDAEGRAPCCDPPAVEDLVCDEGATVQDETSETFVTFVCRQPGQTRFAGDLVAYRATYAQGAEGAELNYSVAGTVTKCGPNGRKLQAYSQATACIETCWDADGSESDWCVTPANEARCAQ